MTTTVIGKLFVYYTITNINNIFFITVLFLIIYQNYSLFLVSANLRFFGQIIKETSNFRVFLNK